MNHRHLFILLVLASPAAGHAQQATPEVFVGSEMERYLRYLQSDGRAALYPWSIGAFSPAEIDRIWPVDSSHPWVHHYSHPPGRDRLTVVAIAPTLTAIGNSGFAYGSNDGPIWAGRGMTAGATAGFAARFKSLSLTVAPLVFAAQNAAFDILANGYAGKLAFADDETPESIDRPQRFGSGVYRVLDPGQSTLRIDLPLVTAGVSTANERWGPGEQFPILLGANAAGYPHAFVGTSAPLDLWLFKLHGRVEWGVLSQSAFSTTTSPDSARRFMSGLVAVVTPRGLPGLELGGARFFHTPWPREGLRFRDFRKPLESFLKVAVPDDVPGETNEDFDNQLASAFFRWVFPRSGLEIYGEYGREDHNWDLRDFVLEPDHASGYMLGLRKVFRRNEGRFLAVRTEMVDLERSSLIQGRPQGPLYIHAYVRQGHTNRGQVLGADVGGDGSGTSVVLDSYHQRGRWSVGWSRVLRRVQGDYWRSGVLVERSRDVTHAISLEALFLRRFVDITGHLETAYDFNRNLVSDAVNLNGFIRVRIPIGLKGAR